MGSAHLCQLNVKPAWLQGFCPHPQPLSHREKGARDLVPQLQGEKGLGDEGAIVQRPPYRAFSLS
ncbi:hypothetical protein FDUTEX481_02156 [Tolypothrix sp. PCC 7601]|nr:hypothetical protein FDUTEX481_02156 [Tolypothrix sp. PCC 7601]BAY94180.1 hypothetical protein NIES3275_62250 [Microchaete diplosiphon NIES-3275]